MTAPLSNRETTNWRELYEAAILELDQSKISAQIVEAEKAILERAKELFQEDGDSITYSQSDTIGGEFENNTEWNMHPSAQINFSTYCTPVPCRRAN